MDTIKANEIVLRDDLYPRFEADQATINKYSDSTEFLPPVEINQNNILIDGYHRWKAFMVAGIQDIPCTIIETSSEKELKQLAYRKNSHHGLQLSNAEKRHFAQEMFNQMSKDEIANILGVSQKSINRWTKAEAKAAKDERNRRIIELYLKAWNTQQDIADALEIESKGTINNVLSLFKKRHLSKIEQNLQPFLYNIWTASKGDEGNNHFGAFPQVFMDNLLYYHTEPLDIVYDPFGGGGTTIDACKKMFRRYYVSDRIVKPGREQDIKQHDIKDGLPDNLPKPQLAFIDPPYWKQAEGKYSQDNEDLANMSLECFNERIQCLLSELSTWGVDKIAIVIQPTQYKNDFEWTDHIFAFDKMLESYQVEMRYMLPYSTEQYLPQMVEKAKENRKCLSSHRDLIVWRLNK